jgi:hypothetical protein
VFAFIDMYRSNFVDLRTHIAAMRRGIFGPRGWPSLEIQECSPLPQRTTRTTKQREQTNKDALPPSEFIISCASFLIKCSAEKRAMTAMRVVMALTTTKEPESHGRLTMAPRPRRNQGLHD